MTTARRELQRWLAMDHNIQTMLQGEAESVGFSSWCNGVEVTVHYWHPTERRVTHFHVSAGSMPEGVERARKMLEKVTAQIGGEDGG